jgi:hypothetical protein
MPGLAKGTSYKDLSKGRPVEGKLLDSIFLV